MNERPPASEGAAGTSEGAAGTSEGAAGTSEGAADTSESAAGTSKDAAHARAGTASSSEGAASSDERAARSGEGTAHTSGSAVSSSRKHGSALLTMAALVVVFAGIKAAEQLMVPFLLAAFIATIAATPVFWLHRRWNVPVGVAIATVVLALIVALLGVGALIAQSVAEFQIKLPSYQQRLEDLQRGTMEILANLGIDISTLQGLDPQQALGFAGNALASLSNVLTNGFVILLAVIFILAEAYTFPRKLRTVLADPERDLPHFERFAANVNRYIAIKTSVSVATGVFVGLSLWIIGVDYPLLWGVLTFLLNYVPNIGSILAAIPPMLLAGVQLGFGGLAATMSVFVAVNIVMGNVVEPRFMGRTLGLSTLVVFLSLVFWNWMLGPVGMLLSVPLTMTVKIALEANPATEWIAHLLDPAESERQTQTEPP